MNQTTFFASGPRDTTATVVNEAIMVSRAQIVQQLLDAIPDVALILNDKRQIVAANEYCLKVLGVQSIAEIIGKRTGEAVNCLHAFEGPMGCGTSEACRDCGAAHAILRCLNSQDNVQRECHITAIHEGHSSSMEFLAKANFVQIGPYPMVLLVLRDISAEKRRQTLERLFFHDVLNTVGGMAGLADLMVIGPSDRAGEYAQTIQRLASNVAEEVSAYRNLLQAEAGTLKLDVSRVSISELFQEVIESLAHHPVSAGRNLMVESRPSDSIETDRVLLRRVVSNLVKNAVEAAPKGSVITLSSQVTENGLLICVNNPGTMSESVQHQLFTRSFTTSGERGRGLGTYSIKLLTERYLNGHVTFESSEGTGTIFKIELAPLDPDSPKI